LYQEGHAVTGNYRAMRDTCTESLHLISGNAVNRNKSETICKHGMLSKNHFTSASVKNGCMSPHGITGPPDQSSRNLRNEFPLARPRTQPNFVALRQKSVWNISCGKHLIPEKKAKVHPRSPDLSPIDRSYRSFYRHSLVTLALDCFVSVISLVLYRNCHFCTYPLVFYPKCGDVPLELDRWAVKYSEPRPWPS